MQKAIYLTFIFFLTISDLQSQVVIKGRIPNLPGSVNQVAIDKWSGESWTELDRLDIGADKTFNKSVKWKYGQARLRLWGEPTHWIDFIMPENPSRDSMLDFGTIDYTYMDGNPAKLKGKENEAYYVLLTDHKKYRLLRDSLLRNDSLPDDVKSSLEEQITKAKTLMNARCREVAGKNKGTLTGDIVCNTLYVPEKADFPANDSVQKLSKPDFERQHLLDRLPFADSRVLLHNGLIRALNQYTSKFLDADSSAYVKRVMEKRNGNPEVDEWIFKYLFNVSLNYKNDAALSYLVKWFYAGNSNVGDNLDQSTQILLAAFRNCEVGKKALDISLPDVGGKTVRLAEIAAKSKLTLLLFWRTDCSHCKEFEPELEELYKQYKSLGLEVIGICVDQADTNWKNYLAANPMSWTNVFPASRDLRIQLITHFPIPGTPTVIAVDRDFKVKNRMVIRATIDKYLEGELGK